MRTDDFDFRLPREMIAQSPVSPRDSARLLVVGDQRLADRHMRDLPSLLRPGDILVFNDTRVIPARLKGRRDGTGVEVTLHDQVAPDAWMAFARPAKKLKAADRLVFGEDLAAVVAEKREGGEVLLRFSLAGESLLAAIQTHGTMPLPPYIKRENAQETDRQDYQTMFAARDGAVAAPTAGLHFTPRLVKALDERGLKRVTVTLHVGAGTFLPVKVEEVRDHKMHAEWGEITGTTAAAINEARAAGGRVIAVGTTSLRLLESAAAEGGRLEPFSGRTDIFITPGYRFKIVDMLLTNFHLPRSTLFMLVCAFSGRERMLAAYEHAKTSGYRFYSYGDACLLERMSA